MVEGTVRLVGGKKESGGVWMVEGTRGEGVRAGGRGCEGNVRAGGEGGEGCSPVGLARQERLRIPSGGNV